ncbi:MAG: NADH-quinone oxidoreductase subunit N [Actinobacteria bacterium]|nr:NADH-quinone oxidoreductase subunit N [Actinomycetota bacterium]
MTTLLAAAGQVHGPSVEYGSLLPILILAGGAIVTIFVSLIGGRAAQRLLTPITAIVTLVSAGVVFAVRIGEPDISILGGALALDDVSAIFDLLFVSAALCASVLVWRSDTLREAGAGEFFSLLITTVLGMAILVSATNLVTFFLGFELFSIPLYVLCAADLRRNTSLEAGLKYLLIGSLGSAVLLYGLSMIYGATGHTDYASIARAVSLPALRDDPLLLAGVALTLAGLAFKASVAPFHQWTPDVYQGAPTPVAAFMAVATKFAVIAVLLRVGMQALGPAREHWEVMVAMLATVTIFVGNIGALRQESLKRMLAYSGVAQVGYVLAGIVAGTWLGVYAIGFYLFAYLAMNIGPFAVIATRERSGAGDGMRGMRNLGREAPWLAWPMTICMLALAGLPVTAGFVGKLLLMQAAIDGHYAWLAVMIALGSAISLGYYLRVVAAIWMPSAVRDEVFGDGTRSGTSALAGAAPEADAARHPELVALAVTAAAASVLFGFYPRPLLELARILAYAGGQLIF